MTGNGLRPVEFVHWVQANCSETEVLPLTTHDWDYYLAGMLEAGAAGFLTLGPEHLTDLSDAEIKHYIQHHGGPRSYYLRTFQSFLRERGLIQTPEPDLLTPRLAGIPPQTAQLVRAYLDTLRRRNYSPATIESITLGVNCPDLGPSKEIGKGESRAFQLTVEPDAEVVQGHLRPGE